MKRSKSPSLVYRTPLYRTPRSHDRTRDSAKSAQNRSKSHSVYSDIDQMMFEMDINTPSANLNVATYTKDRTILSERRKSLFMTPVRGNEHYNGFITDAHKRRSPSRTKRRNPLTSQTSLMELKRNDSNLLNLVRSLRGPDFNDDLDTTDVFDDGTGFMFLSGEAYEDFMQQELKTRTMSSPAKQIPAETMEYSPSVAHRAYSRPDSALTFISTLEPLSAHRSSSLDEINDETVSPERKLACVEEFCTDVMSSFYQRGLNEKDLHQIADVRITGVALARMIYGPKSLQFAHQIIQLASVYVKMNTYEQAMPHLSKALELITEHLGKSKKSYNNIALFSSVDPNKLKVMLKEGKKLLPILLTSLGRCYLDIGMITDANTCLQEAYRQHKLIYDESDTSKENEFEYDILLSLNDLYMKLEKPEKAMKCLEQAWELKEALVGSEQHPDIAKIYREMGTVHWKSGSNDEAISAFTKSQSIYTSLAGEVNAANASIVSYFLGVVHYSSGNLDRALGDLEISLKGVEAFFGPLHNKTLRVYRKLAELALEKAKICLADSNVQQFRRETTRETEYNEDQNVNLLIKKTVFLYRELLKRQLESYGEESESVAMTYEILGDVYAMQDDHLKASLMLKKATEIMTELFGANDRRTMAASDKYNEANSELYSQETNILYDE